MTREIDMRGLDPETRSDSNPPLHDTAIVYPDPHSKRLHDRNEGTIYKIEVKGIMIDVDWIIADEAYDSATKTYYNFVNGQWKIGVPYYSDLREYASVELHVVEPMTQDAAVA